MVHKNIQTDAGVETEADQRDITFEAAVRSHRDVTESH